MKLRTFKNMPYLVLENHGLKIALTTGPAKKICRKLLKNMDVDIIASDSHNTSTRVNNLAKCYDYVVKKYGSDYADLLFKQNPARIVTDS